MRLSGSGLPACAQACNQRGSNVMRRSGFRGWWLALLCAALMIPGVSRATAQQKKSVAQPRTHTYYIAADEVEWDYAPGGINKITGQPFDRMEQIYTERGPHRIGKVYRKAIYREYTDATFSKL